MAFTSSTALLPRLVVSSLLAVLLLVASPPPAAFAQSPATPAPTMAACTPQLVALLPCMPFVQGSAKTPVQSCCDNLNQLYNSQPGCLCLLFSNTSSSPAAINRTLAAELPALCKLNANISSCSGQTPSPIPASGSPVSLGATNNSTVASSPYLAPLPSTTLGHHSNNIEKLKATGHLAIVAVLLSKLLI